MSDKELYKKKMQSQLDEWKAEIDKLRARASGSSADAQLALNKRIKDLDAKVDTAEAKLAELGEAGEAAWESVKERVESAWGSLKAALSDAGDRNEG